MQAVAMAPRAWRWESRGAKALANGSRAHAAARACSRRSALRTSLAACIVEGAAAEVVAACCGGAALTGWALHLGLTTKVVAMLGALPIAAQALQVVGALLTTRFGHRRTAVIAMAISRQAFLPLVVLPALPLAPEGRRELLLVVAGVHHGLGVVASNAWNDLIGETVPRRLRGRFFGRRTAMSTVAGGLTALGAGVALDGAQRLAAAGPVLQVLALLASAAGALSLVLVMRQHGWPPRCLRSLPERASTSIVRPFLDPQARPVIVYSVAWHAACGLSAPYFGLYLLQDLRTGYALLAVQGGGFALARVASASAWGRAVDRVGAHRVLAVCTAGLALSPLSWIACDTHRLWPLALEAAVGGVLFGGHTVASFAMQLSIAPSRHRAFYLAAIAAAGGLAFACTAAGGALADGAAGTSIPLRTLLAGSAALRLAAVISVLPLSARVRESRRRCDGPAHTVIAPPIRADEVVLQSSPLNYSQSSGPRERRPSIEV